MKCLPSLCLALCCCLFASSTVMAQGAYIRPFAPPPSLPGHGFYISTIEMLPEHFTGNNPSYTAKVVIQVRDLPGFVSKSQPIELTIEHVKASETMQQLQGQAKDLADKQIDLIVKTLQDYKTDFDKNRQ